MITVIEVMVVLLAMLGAIWLGHKPLNNLSETDGDEDEETHTQE